MKKNINKRRQAILFLSNKTSDTIIGEFKSLVSSIGDSADVFFVYHQNSAEVPAVIQELNYFPFTDAILQELKFKPLDNHSLLPGSDHFPLFKFYLAHPNYDYYWHIEDDVRFCGKWSYIFEAFQKTDADFIASHVTKRENDPHWYWWNSLTKNGKSVSLENALKSFNAIHRISNRALNFLHTELLDGWGGHHEVVIPTLLYRKNFKIIDWGGGGAFVPAGNEYKFYTNDSMTFIPICFGDIKNRIYHPVKEYKKNCLIAAVGKTSLHKYWLPKTQNYDVHLIVYDDSYPRFKRDTAYISIDKGYKLKMVYRYLEKHPKYLEQYEYFFIPDDDILISNEDIEMLFELMQKYSLSIAQPTMFDSYYTYDSLIKDKYTILRYTNFVEMMLPCFSKDTLKKVLFTFNENESGWGADTHWPKIINPTKNEMAVVDIIIAHHTRPIQSGKPAHFSDLKKYMLKYNLKKEINKEYDCIYRDKMDKFVFIPNRNKYKLIENVLNTILELLGEQHMQIECPGLFNGKLGLSLFYLNYYRLTGNRNFYNMAFSAIEIALRQTHAIKNDITLSSGLAGIGWLIEYLAQNKYIENDTDKILEEISCKIDDNIFSTCKDINSDNGLIGIGIYYLMRTKNPFFSPDNEMHLKEKEILKQIINRLQNYLHEKTTANFSDIDIHDIAHLVLFFARYNTIEKYNFATFTNSQTKWLEKQCFHYFQNECLPNSNYLLLAYALFHYFSALNQKEQQENVIEFVLNRSKGTANNPMINSNINTLREFIQSAYIYFLFYQKSGINDFKNLTLFFLDKVVEEKENLKKESQSLAAGNIKGLLSNGLILMSLLLDVETDWTILI